MSINPLKLLFIRVSLQLIDRSSKRVCEWITRFSCEDGCMYERLLLFGIEEQRRIDEFTEKPVTAVRTGIGNNRGSARAQ
ncbi:hypothetical protein D3C85_1301560 [compost metagenome]